MQNKNDEKFFYRISSTVRNYISRYATSLFIFRIEFGSKTYPSLMRTGNANSVPR